jgi:hypothetical protein
MINQDPKAAALSSEAAQLLWAVSFDDDDVAGAMLDMFVVAGATRWLDEQPYPLAQVREERVRRLEREVRIRCIRQEEELAERICQYARDERLDDIPF